MDFTPFDINCYNNLQQRFEFLFEPKLINEICQIGNLKVFQEDENGELVYDYYERGRKLSFDDEGQEWLDDIWKDLVRNLK